MTSLHQPDEARAPVESGHARLRNISLSAQPLESEESENQEKRSRSCSATNPKFFSLEWGYV